MKNTCKFTVSSYLVGICLFRPFFYLIFSINPMMSSYFSKIPSLRFQWPWNPHLSKVSLALLVLVIMLCSWFTGTLPMVSNSTDIHPTPEGTKLRDQVTSSRATWSQRWPTMRWVATFFLFFRGFVLLLPFFIHIKLSVSEIASCTSY